MKAKTPNTMTTTETDYNIQENNQRSLMKVATHMVDSVTDLLCSQIANGYLRVSEHQQQLIHNYQSLSPSHEEKTIDIDEHKRMIRKFMQMNKKYRNNRQKRSIENSERKTKEDELRRREEQENKSKILESRRKQIQKRMNDKKNMFKEIQKSALDSNTRLSSLKKKKFLYQEKEEEFYKNVLLPKLEHEKSVLSKKKELRKPIDMSELYHHEKQYEEYKINERLNRSITVKMVKQQNPYIPPQFVPQSYKRAKIQEQIAREQERIKQQEHQVNSIRKRQYAKKIDQIRQRQRQLSRSFQKSPQDLKETKQKAKPKLNREEVKTVGNQYLKELLANNRKFMTTRKLKPIDEEPQKRKVRSQYQIEIVREERIQKIKKIRNKKIDQILNDNKLSQYQRNQKLKHQIDRLDQAAQDKFKQNSSVETANESATIMMSSIHAKLALLGLNSPK